MKEEKEKHKMFVHKLTPVITQIVEMELLQLHM